MNNDNALEASGNSSEQKGTDWTFRDLTAKELQAIQLRFEGKSSTEIAVITGFQATYVRKLFMKGGRLCQAYEDFAQYHKQGAKEVAELVIKRAKEEAPKAIERMVALSQDQDNGPVCYKANEKLLELGGVGLDTSLKAQLQGLTYESAKDRVNQVFILLYGKPVEVNIQINIEALRDK